MGIHIIESSVTKIDAHIAEMFLFPLTLTEKKIQNTTNQALKCAENRKKHQENINNIEHLFKYHNKRSNITVKRPLSINIRKKNLTKKTM